MPNLSLDALRTRIHDRALAPVHAFIGEDAILMDRMVDAVEATIDEADRPFAVERLYAGDDGGSPVEIAAAARGLPMLGDRRIVVVLRAERLLKPKRAGRSGQKEDVSGAAPESDAEATGAEGGDEGGDALDMGPLEDYLDDPSPSTIVVFVAAAVNRTRRFSKRVLAKAHVTVFGGIGGDKPADRRKGGEDAMARVREAMAEAGRTIDPAAARLLVERAGGDISRLRGDLDRILLYSEGRPRVTREDALAIVSTDIPVGDDWGVTNALSAGDAGRALLEAGLRLDRGDSPHMLLGQLRWWVSTRLAEGDPGRVRGALEALLRTDLALKSSGGDHRVLIERLVVELTGRPVASGRGWR